MSAFSLYYTVKREFFRIAGSRPGFFLGTIGEADWVIIISITVLGTNRLGIGKVIKTLGLVIIIGIGEVILVIRNGISL